jgi:hypothetical protein
MVGRGDAFAALHQRPHFATVIVDGGETLEHENDTFRTKYDFL